MWRGTLVSRTWSMLGIISFKIPGDLSRTIYPLQYDTCVFVLKIVRGKINIFLGAGSNPIHMLIKYLLYLYYREVLLPNI